jgi:nitroreductase
MPEEHDELTHHGIDDSSNASIPNDTLRILLTRASCRSFEDRAVSDEVLNAILEAGTRAATGGNLQPYSIICVRSRETRKLLAELNEDQSFIATAPVDLIFCIDFRRLGRWAALEKAPFTAHRSFRHFWISFQDTIIAAQTVCTAADALGLGSCYVGTIIDRLREHRRLLQLPDGVFPAVLLALGYPKFRPATKKKLGPSCIVHDEVYRDAPDTDLRAMYESKYPGWKKEITPDRLEEIMQVCRRVGGESLAKECRERIEQNGYINVAQNYFGLHYRADLMPQGNEEYLNLMREFGFSWFEKYASS